MSKNLVFFLFFLPLIVSAEEFRSYGVFDQDGRLDEYCQNIEEWYQSTINPWYKPYYYGGVISCYERSDEYKNIPVKERGQALKKKFDSGLYVELIAEAVKSGEPLSGELAEVLRYSTNPEANEIIIKSKVNKAYKDYYDNEDRDHILRPYLENNFQSIWVLYLEHNRVKDAERVLGDFYQFMCTRREYHCRKEDNQGDVRKPFGRMSDVFEDDKVKGYQEYLRNQKPLKAEEKLSPEELRKQRDKNARNAVKNLMTPREYDELKKQKTVVGQ